MSECRHAPVLDWSEGTYIDDLTRQSGKRGRFFVPTFFGRNAKSLKLGNNQYIRGLTYA